MKRTAIVSLLWMFTIVLTAGIAYWIGQQEIRTIQVAPDPEMAKPLAESQRQVSLPPDLEIVQPLTNQFQRFVAAQGKLELPDKRPKGKLDLPDKPPKEPSPPLNNPLKDEKPDKGWEPPEYIPCRTRDSRGEWAWGVCLRRKF